MRLAAAFAAALLTLLAIAAGYAGPADAATARVTFAPTTADPDYATRFTLHGSGFQAVKGGFGGIYVLFGTVKGAWQPSKGGVSGQDFVYVQDSETKDNHGYERFVSFQDGGTLYAANGGIINPDGTWSADLVVPGSKFPARGRDGGVEQIDCLQVQCGIITVGAHGVVDPQNETFTPVRFAVPEQQHVAPPATQARTSTSSPASKSPAATVKPTPSPVRTTSSSSAASASGLVIPSTSSTPTTVAADPALKPAAASSDASSATGWWVGGVVAGIVLLGLGGGFALRRRARGATGSGGTA
jgi:hypothetical protein